MLIYQQNFAVRVRTKIIRPQVLLAIRLRSVVQRRMNPANRERSMIAKQFRNRFGELAIQPDVKFFTRTEREHPAKNFLRQ